MSDWWAPIKHQFDPTWKMNWPQLLSSSLGWCILLRYQKGISQSCGLDDSPESALLWIGSMKKNYIMIFDNADALPPATIEAFSHLEWGETFWLLVVTLPWWLWPHLRVLLKWLKWKKRKLLCYFWKLVVWSHPHHMFKSKCLRL